MAGKVKKLLRSNFLTWTHHREVAKYVASRIQLSLRKDNLTWTHHREVASLTPSEQSEWLERAAAEHLSVRALHEAIHGAPVGVWR